MGRLPVAIELIIVSYKPILTKIALPEIPGTKKKENAINPPKEINGRLSTNWMSINPIKNPNIEQSKNSIIFL